MSDDVKLPITPAELGAIGGRKRADKLSPEEKSEIASIAARRRWSKIDEETGKPLPKAIFGSDDRPLVIGTMRIPCYVLDNDIRVLTAAGVQEALKIAAGGSMKKGMSRLELFSSGKSINPHVSNELHTRVSAPILFMLPSGGRAYGYDAEILVELCEAVLASRAAGDLNRQQHHIAQQCELIMRGLARVGIVALVDEATGFQEVRERDALHKILEAYIAPELMPWTKRFPASFYKEMFRLHRWTYDPTSVARPGVVGKFTNAYIYEQLPDGVLDELRTKNPKGDFGRRRARHHQFLSDDVGNPHLERQIAATTALMRAADDWPMFKKMFKRAFERSGEQMEMRLDHAS